MRKFALIVMYLAFTVCKAQTLHCGTPSPTASDLQAFKIAKEQHDGTERINSGELRRIPVAVHVISKESTDANNIDLSQIENAIQILNDDFRGVNGPMDTKIEFCLAGVRRIQHPVHHSVTIGFNDEDAKELSQEPPSRFLNIWVVDNIDVGGSIVQGFAPFPSLVTGPDTLYDGVMIRDEHFGEIGTANIEHIYNEGHTLAHEVGHYLFLFHTFQGGCDYNWNCNSEGDCCCDTPPVAQSSNDCRKKDNTCDSDDPDKWDNIRNFMCYCEDEWRSQFSWCQLGRMELALAVWRPGLCLTTPACPQLKTGNTAFNEPFTRSIFPNPHFGSGELSLMLHDDKPILVQVSDCYGRLLSSFMTYESGAISLDLPEGVSFVTVQSGQFRKTITTVSSR